jgi:hypothetical protein
MTDTTTPWDAADPATTAFLLRNIRSIMITLRSDGSPTGHPMSAFFGANGLFFNMYGGSAKARNLRRDPRMCALVTTFDPPPRRDAICVRGNARFVPSTEEAVLGDEDGRRRARLANPAVTAGGAEPQVDPAEAERRRARAAQAVIEGKRVIVELIPVELGAVAPPSPVRPTREAKRS